MYSKSAEIKLMLYTLSALANIQSAKMEMQNYKGTGI